MILWWLSKPMGLLLWHELSLVLKFINLLTLEFALLLRKLNLSRLQYLLNYFVYRFFIYYKTFHLFLCCNWGHSILLTHLVFLLKHVFARNNMKEWCTAVYWILVIINGWKKILDLIMKLQGVVLFIILGRICCLYVSECLFFVFE